MTTDAGTGTGTGTGGAGDAGNTGVDNGAAASWRDTLPDDIKGDKSLADIKDITGLAKGYVHSQKLIGSSVRIPGPDAGKEDLGAFYEKLLTVPGIMRMPDASDAQAMEQLYTKLGRPATPEEYKITKPEKLPDGVAINDDMLKSVSATAHKLGLTNAQLQGLVDWQIQDTIARAEQNAKANKDGEVALRKEYGPAYDQRMGAAKMLIDKFADPATAAELKEAFVSYPGLARMLANAGVNLLEDAHVNGNGGGLAPTTAELRAQIAEIKNNSDHPYHDKGKPGHKEAIERVNNMYKQIAEAERAA